MIRIGRVLIVAVAAVAVAHDGTETLAQDARQLVENAKVSPAETARLVAVLESDAPVYDKAIACKKLAVVGTTEAVPVLAALLSDATLAHYARYALEPMPEGAVDEALRNAAGKLDGKLLVGVLNTIGNRKDAGAIDTLAKRLSDSDPAVAAAAAAALGRIGTVRAARILNKTLESAPAATKAAVADSCLACAEGLLARNNQKAAVAMYDAVLAADLPKHLKLAATYGAIRTLGDDGLDRALEQLGAKDKDFFNVGLRMVREFDGSDVTKALLASLKSVDGVRKILVIRALADRGDEEALPAVLEAAKAGPPELRLAAIRSLKQLGDASAVTLLLDTAVGADEAAAQAAQAVLEALEGSEVDSAIVAKLAGDDPKARPVAIALAGRRRIRSAIPALLKAAEGSDQATRVAALGALGETVGVDKLSVLVARAVSLGSPEETAAAKEALAAACGRLPREACAAELVGSLPEAPLETKQFLFGLLGSVGGETAIKALSAAARDPNVEVQDAATRVLGEWMTADAAGVLLELAKSPDSKFRIRALRGYIRIPRQLALSPDQRLAMCREALAVADRLDEKKLILGVLVRNPSPEVLAFAVEMLDSPGAKNYAAAAAVSIGQKILRTDPGPVAEAMKKVLASGAGAGQANRAKALLSKVEKQ